MILFADRGCPFAHRVLALLEHLGCPPDLRESMVGEKPDGVEQYSANGVIPLLVHDDLVLRESRVMLEHIAEHYAFVDAYPVDLVARSRHRQAMAVVDDFLAPLLFDRTDADVDGPRLGDALLTLEAATATGAPQPQLLAMHIAPIWLRFQLWHPAHAVTRAIEARPVLCGWLDAALQLDCLRRTAPDPVTHLHDVAAARALGILPK
jgi:glutathione S-transferase